MPTDRYTRIVLTVIAAALVALVAQNAIPGATAQADRPQRFMVCGATPPHPCADVRPVLIGDVRFNSLLTAEPVR